MTVLYPIHVITKCVLKGLHCICLIILAATCDFQECGNLTCLDSDEPVWPPFKLRNSK